MLNEQYLDNNVEQGIASYIDYLNNIRLSDLLNSLDAILSTETDKLSDLATRSANALSNLDLAKLEIENPNIAGTYKQKLGGFENKKQLELFLVQEPIAEYSRDLTFER